MDVRTFLLPALLGVSALGAPPVAARQPEANPDPLRAASTLAQGEGPGVVPAAPPDASSTTGDASVPGMQGEPVRIERRLLTKSGRVMLAAGPTYLARGDYLLSPGLQAALSFYPSEAVGLELRFGFFATFLQPSAERLFEATGLLPDTSRPSGQLAVGLRLPWAYGKLLVGSSVVHFEPQLSSHVGLLFTDRETAFAADLGLGLLVHLGDGWHLQVDLPVVASLGEPVTVGLLPQLSLGRML